MFVIDPGHGGKDSGSVGRFIVNNQKVILKESDLNLQLSLKLASALRALGKNVFLTRTQDVFVELKDRCFLANKERATYFISIHHNGAAKPEAHGTEVLVYDKLQIAPALRGLANQLFKSTGFKNRGVIQRQSVYVLRRTKMPSILLEIGFMTNPEEALTCANEQFQNKLATELAWSLNKFS